MQCKHSPDDGPVEQRIQLLSSGTSYDTVQTYNWQWSTQRPNIVILQSCNYVHKVVSLYFRVETVRSLHKPQLFTVNIKSQGSTNILQQQPTISRSVKHTLNEQSRMGRGGGVRRAWAWAWSRSLSTNTPFSLSEGRNFLISRVTVNIRSRTLPHGLGYNSWTDK